MPSRSTPTPPATRFTTNSIAQTFTTPTGATLKDNTTRVTTTILANTCSNTGAWAQVTAALVAGHSYTLTLLDRDDGAGAATTTRFDHVTVP